MKSLLDSLTPEQQFMFLSTKDNTDVDGKTAVQWAPADERKGLEKKLNHYKLEADFEVNYGTLALLSHLAWTSGTRDDIGKIYYFVRNFHLIT